MSQSSWGTFSGRKRLTLAWMASSIIFWMDSFMFSPFKTLSRWP